jgi:hypothetical protein
LVIGSSGGLDSKKMRNVGDIDGPFTHSITVVGLSLMWREATVVTVHRELLLNEAASTLAIYDLGKSRIVDECHG